MENYPNPSVDRIHIRYRVADKMKVTLKLFDRTGKLIAVPVNDENRTEGSYELNYPVSNLANGIYFATIAVNGTTVQSLKLSVAK